MAKPRNRRPHALELPHLNGLSFPLTFLTLVRSDANRIEIRHGAVASEVTLPVVEVA